MKSNRTASCVLLAGCLVFGAGGCGTFDLLAVLGAMAKINGGEASKVTAAEWQLLSRTAADLAESPELALTASQAEALAYFLSANGIDVFGERPEKGGMAQGLEELATAFSSRAEGQDVNNHDVLMQVLQGYLQQIGETLAGAFGGSFGPARDGSGGPEGPGGPGDPDGGGAV